MKQITSITASNGDAVVEGALEKLAEYAATLGLGVEKIGRWKYERQGSYLETSFRFTVGGDDAIEAKAQLDFEMAAPGYGLQAGDYGAILKIRGKRYKLTKINTRRRVTYPFVCEGIDSEKGILLPLEYNTIIAAARK